MPKFFFTFDANLYSLLFRYPQVETYGSMTRREKASLILEQMRLCLAKQDFVRTQIIAKKINVKFFEDEKDEETQVLKLKYYEWVLFSINTFCI